MPAQPPLAQPPLAPPACVADRAARLPLARLPTPLEDAPRLAHELGLARLWIKREDQAGYGLGGNKLRQLDAILGEALAAGCDAVVTTAAAQSNFCRSMAAACARLGLHCALVLRGTPGTPLQGNLLLDHVFGAEVAFIDTADPWDPSVGAMLRSTAAGLESRGFRPAIVQLTGPTAPVAAAAWADGARELDTQLVALGARPAAAYVAVGSGLTLAGLAAGFALVHRDCTVAGISVQQPAARLDPWIREAIAAVAQRSRAPRVAATARFALDDTFIAPGYGRPSPASVEAVRTAGRLEGLALDPIYSGKAMAGLIAHARDGRLSGREVVFVHSGGTPGLFAHAEAFAEGA